MTHLDMAESLVSMEERIKEEMRRLPMRYAMGQVSEEEWSKSALALMELETRRLRAVVALTERMGSA